MTYRVGWGGTFGGYPNQYRSFTNNRQDGLVYDAAGNLSNDGAQYTYDARGQQTNGAYPAGWGGYANYSLQQSYDGDGLRVKKVDNGTNPNCLQMAVKDSPGVSRGVDAEKGPNGPTGNAVHDGDHALSPQGIAADASTLAPLTGTVIRKARQASSGPDAKLGYLDVELDHPINGVAYNARYKDLSSISVGIGDHLKAGDVFGTVRPGGDPRSAIGLHVTLVKRSEYGAYVNRVRRGQSSPIGIFMSAANDPNSPVRCP